MPTNPTIPAVKRPVAISPGALSATPSVNTMASSPVAPNTLPSPVSAVPSDYAKLGVTTGYAPKSPDQLRFFVIGPSGDGKTAFWAGCPNTLIFDFEDGAWGIPSPRAHRIVCKTYNTYAAIRDKLLADAKAGRRPYNRIVIDTIDSFVELVNPKLAAEKKIDDITDFGAKGAGWSLLRTECWNDIAAFESAGYAWTCIGHITEKTLTVNGKERTVTRPVLFDSFAKQIGRNADYIATIHSDIQQVPQYRTVQGRTVECGAIDKVVYVLEATAVGSLLGTAQNKQRGIPTFKGKVLLPDLMSGQYGWDAFCDAYNASVAEVRASGQTPSPAPPPEDTVLSPIEEPAVSHSV